MGYRFEDRPKPNPEDLLPRFFIRNGTILKIALPCFYLDVISEHDSKYHDHVGWPSPTHVDCICQFPGSGMERIDFQNPHPIDLTSEYEGYESVEFIFDEDVAEQGLVAVASFSEEEPNTIYLTVSAHGALFIDESHEYKFTVFACSETRIDQVIRGIIVVLPSNTITPDPQIQE